MPITCCLTSGSAVRNAALSPVTRLCTECFKGVDVRRVTIHVQQGCREGRRWASHDRLLEHVYSSSSVWDRNHPQYLINAYYMLSCIGGYASDTMAQNLTWAWVCKTKGIPHEDVSLYLVNERLNLDFKEMLEASSVVTAKEVLRCSSMSVAFGRHMDNIFTQSGLGDMATTDRK